MERNNYPKVAVLLAAYNGSKYIKEQIESILNQVLVDTHIYISIDASTDETLKTCSNLQKKYKNIHIISKGELKFGSAGHNFYHLIKNIDFNNFEYISFSDQDDLWKPNKLHRGIEILIKKNVSGYSSDVECFWDDRSKKNIIIKKSYPQVDFDYFFEPAGPGCTYIINKSLALFLQNSIKNNIDPPIHHDWYIYALARINNYKWHIDNQANIYYRQHRNNQVGANSGFYQKLKRIKKLQSGEYKREYSDILKSIGITEKIELKKTLLKNPFQFRRKKTEAVSLLLFFLIGWI